MWLNNTIRELCLSEFKIIRADEQKNEYRDTEENQILLLLLTQTLLRLYNVPNGILLIKLSWFEFGCRLLKLLENYITGRKQFVKADSIPLLYQRSRQCVQNFCFFAELELLID